MKYALLSIMTFIFIIASSHAKYGYYGDTEIINVINIERDNLYYGEYLFYTVEVENIDYDKEFSVYLGGLSWSENTESFDDGNKAMYLGTAENGKDLFLLKIHNYSLVNITLNMGGKSYQIMCNGCL